MGNHDASAYHQADRKEFHELVVGDTLLGAADPFRKTPMAALYGRAQSGHASLDSELR